MDELFTARMVIDDFVARKGITVDEIGAAPIVVISWGRRVIHSLAEKIDAQLSEHWPYRDSNPLYFGQVAGKSVSLVQVPVGAPGTVMMMEAMIACGTRIFLGLGWAGSLQAHAPVGTFLIPTACIREEGTSYHYIDEDESLFPDAGLVEMLETAVVTVGAQVLKGPLWTTDAPYRELRSKIATYSKRGVLGVDMETSAMYALGQFRAVRVCNLLVVSDELGQEWHHAFGTPELQEATQKAEGVMLCCLRGDLEC